MSKILQATFRVTNLEKNSNYFTTYFGGKSISKGNKKKTF